MSELALSPAASAPASAWLDRACRAAVLQRLDHLTAGAVRIREAGCSTTPGLATGPLGIVELEVADPRFWRAVARRGALGAGEAYVDGQWRTTDLVRLVRLLVRDRAVLQGLGGGGAGAALAWLRGRWQALWPNGRARSRSDIAAHYDLGNDFFACFLDPSLTYSSAVFPRPETTLAEAQQEKLERLCRLLDLQRGDRLLEIGSGWGALALHAAGEHGARVTTTTISPAQHRLCVERVAAAGLADRIEVQLRDYRDLRGHHDKLVSVEMVEAVGARNLPLFFRRCGELLEPGGRMALQAITIADQDYARSLRTVDFIKAHVFPGSFIPSTTALLSAATASSDLRLRALRDHGDDYARTLACWRENLHRNADRIRALGHSERRLRCWDYYFAYCEGGYREGRLGVVQMGFERPAA